MNAPLNTNGLNHMVLNALPVPGVIINRDGNVIAANQSWLDEPIYFGEQHNAYPGLYGDQQELNSGISRVLTGELAIYKRELVLSADRGTQTYCVNVTAMKDRLSEIAGALVVFYNITQQKKLEQTLNNGAEQYRLIANYSKDMIKVTDVNGRVEYSSPSHEHILGYSNETDIFEFVHPDDVKHLENLLQEALQTADYCVLEIRKRHRNGEWIWLETACSPVWSDEGNVQNFIFITREISERKQLQHELEWMAYHDFLTGLYNRRRIRLLMEEVLALVSNEMEQFAVLILDLDCFKRINDNYGHDSGDLVLKEFAARLLCIKKEDDFVGRLSGDEFAVVMRAVNGEEDIRHFIERIQHALMEPCIIPALEFQIQLKVSVGYSIYPEHGDTIEELYKYADVALYKEKQNRIGRFAR